LGFTLRPFLFIYKYKKVFQLDMAAQVLSGSGNVTYTNSTGQNVRVVINYLKNITATGTMSFQGVTVELAQSGIFGKTLAYANQNDGNNSMATMNPSHAAGGIPLEIALSNGETFSITNSSSSTYIEGYNIIIIPEAG